MIAYKTLWTVLALLPAGLAMPTGSVLQSRGNPRAAQVGFNLESKQEDMAAFREKHGKDLPMDYTSMCGGMADSKGKFTDSKQFEIVSFGHPKLGKIMLDTGDLVSGSGEGKFYYDLCSSGGEKGVLDQARFQCSFKFHAFPAQIGDGISKMVPIADFKGDSFQLRDQGGLKSSGKNSMEKFDCKKLDEPIKYTGKQAKDTDGPVYQIVLSDYAPPKGHLGHYGVWANEKEGRLTWDYKEAFGEKATRFQNGQAYRLPSPSDKEGRGVFLLSKLQEARLDNKMTHQCEFKYKSTKGGDGPNPYASIPLILKDSDDLNNAKLGEVKDAKSAEIELLGCKALDKPIEGLSFGEEEKKKAEKLKATIGL